MLLSDRDIKAEITSGRVGIEPYLELLAAHNATDLHLTADTPPLLRRRDRKVVDPPATSVVRAHHRAND